MSDYPDYGGDYYSGYQDGKHHAESARATAAFMTALFKLLFLCFRLFFFSLPGIFCAFVILEKSGYHMGKQNIWNYMGVWIGLVYILECLIFFLKGWSLSLKDSGQRLWMVLWAICFIYCFALPAFLLKTIVFGQFTTPKFHPTVTMIILCWASGIILGWFIFRRYNLLADTSPKWMAWSYRLGRAIG